MNIQPVKYFRVYLTYSDVFGAPATEADLIQELKLFKRTDVLSLLSVVGLILHNESWSSPDVQVFLVRSFFDADSQKKIQDAARNVYKSDQLEEPPVVFTDFQIVNLSKLAILHTSDAYGTGINSTDERFRFGKCFLMMNDLLRKPIQLPRNGEQDALRQSLIEEVIRNGLFHINERFQYSFVRAFELFSNIPSEMRPHPQFYDIPGTFERATGYPVKEYLASGLSIWLWWSVVKMNNVANSDQLAIDPKTFFKNIEVDQIRYVAFLSLLSLEADAYKVLLHKERSGLREEWQFRTSNVTIEQYPIIETGGILLCLSMNFLSRKLTTQPFYLINNFLKDEKERAAFRTFYGRVFEEYVRRLLRRSLADRCSIDYYGSTQEEAGDAVLVYPRSLVITEAKASRLSLDCVRTGNIASYREGLQRVLVASCRQIDRVIAAFKDGRYKLPGTNPLEIGRYYPLIVTAHPFPRETLTSSEMDRLLTEEKLFLARDIAPPTLIDIEELEHLEPLLKAVSLLEVLGSKAGSETSRATSMKNFLIAQYGKLPRNEFLHERFDEIYSFLLKSLFPSTT